MKWVENWANRFLKNVGKFCKATRFTHWVTSQKVAGSVPDGGIGILHWLNPSDRSNAWGRLSFYHKWLPVVSPGDEGGRSGRLRNLPPSCTDCVEILGASVSWSPKDPPTCLTHVIPPKTVLFTKHAVWISNLTSQKIIQAVDITLSRARGSVAVEAFEKNCKTANLYCGLNTSVYLQFRDVVWNK